MGTINFRLDPGSTIIVGVETLKDRCGKSFGNYPTSENNCLNSARDLTFKLSPGSITSVVDSSTGFSTSVVTGTAITGSYSSRGQTMQSETSAKFSLKYKLILDGTGNFVIDPNSLMITPSTFTVTFRSSSSVSSYNIVYNPPYPLNYDLNYGICASASIPCQSPSYNISGSQN